MGHTWYTYMDNANGTAEELAFLGNDGFVDGNNQPYADFVSRVSEINHQLLVIDPACRTCLPPEQVTVGYPDDGNDNGDD